MVHLQSIYLVELMCSFHYTQSVIDRIHRRPSGVPDLHFIFPLFMWLCGIDGFCAEQDTSSVCIYSEWRHISVIKNKYYTECNINFQGECFIKQCIHVCQKKNKPLKCSFQPVTKFRRSCKCQFQNRWKIMYYRKFKCILPICHSIP